MPIYLHIFNLIIEKKAVREKYEGGLNQFRLDYNLPASEIHQEDDELFALGQMDEEIDVDSLTAKGLQFDYKTKRSNDFVLLYRYGDLSWKVDWLEDNKVFAWHVETHPTLKIKAKEISQMLMGDIIAEQEKGNNLFRTIKKQESR